MSIKGVKVDIFLSLVSTRGVSGDGRIYLWCLNNGTLIIINHYYNVIKYDSAEVPFLNLAKFSLSVRIIFYLQIKFNVSIKKSIYTHKINLLYNNIFCVMCFIVST